MCAQWLNARLLCVIDNLLVGLSVGRHSTRSVSLSISIQFARLIIFNILLIRHFLSQFIAMTINNDKSFRVIEKLK